MNPLTRRTILFTTLVAPILAACGAQSTTDTSPAASSKPVTLLFQDWPGDFMDMVQKTAVPAFQAKYPHITVN